ncbi:MAG: hypothetical protein ACOZCP_19330 [Pseudomonadota bacterium]|jgi:hypothetical protein
MFNNTSTSPVIVKGAAEAAAQLEKVAASSLPITREDDWSLTRALDALHELIESNRQQLGPEPR